MEIIINDLSYKNLSNLTFTIHEGVITGITGEGKSTVLRLINGILEGRGKVTYNGERPTKKTKLKVIKEIGYIGSNFTNPYMATTVEEHIMFFIQYHKLSIKDPNKKIKDSLKIVGLNDKYLTRNISSLSSSEKKLLELSTVLLINPKILLLDEPFINMDNKNEKKLARLLDQLNDRFNINVVIASNDSNILYKYTKKVILLKDNKVFMEGDTKEVYSDALLLKKNNFDIPEIVEFVYLAKKKKNVKIDYHRDIRDLIKDIYKHV